MHDSFCSLMEKREHDWGELSFPLVTCALYNICLKTGVSGELGRFHNGNLAFWRTDYPRFLDVWGDSLTALLILTSLLSLPRGEVNYSI